MSEMSRSENIPHCPRMVMHLIESSHDPLSSGYTYDLVPLGQAMMERDMMAHEYLEVGFDLLVHLLHLPIHLWVICGGGGELDVKECS